MLRYALLLTLAVLSLSCASGGTTTDEESASPPKTPGPHQVTYSVYCSGQCTFEVSYRGAEGMGKAQASSRWSHSFSVESGGQVAVTVRRRDSGQGRLFVSLRVDGRDVDGRIMENGETGPITLAGAVQ